MLLESQVSFFLLSAISHLGIQSFMSIYSVKTFNSFQKWIGLCFFWNGKQLILDGYETLIFALKTNKENGGKLNI